MTQVIRVVQPGLFTTIQDLGRPQVSASGVPPGGAMDRFAHSAANLLVGNERGAATLECTLTGPHLTAETPCVIAITGADFDPRINGSSAPTWTGVTLAAGDRLTFGGRRVGARAYIAVAGGVAGDRWLGSMSTNVMCGRGGMGGRPLIGGDVVSTNEPSGEPRLGRTMPDDLRPRYADHTLYAIAGPHLGRLLPESRRALFGAPYRVTHDSNRMGYRLEGPRLEAAGEELLSFGLVAGVVQLPSGGQPILLMADHQTAGGYPIVATLASASMPVAAQLAPGDELRFAETSIEAALAMRAAQRAGLESLTT
ncbi:MAG TPA: biotin-dependent carboxyltransferase family protein [Candidatus Dormibacteraeota bacterium]|nr:biotin-dependent carboxyltransferase family protein [Candidatus Dormibacteraeota bacterium]